MRRDQRPVQVEPESGDDISKRFPMDRTAQPEPPAPLEDVRPMSHRQARENAVLAAMRLEREQLAHRFANLAPNDHARITADETLKGYDEQIARFEQALAGER